MKKYIFGFISGILVSFIFVVFAAIVMKAEDISFNNELSEATNVNEAIDELYTKCGIRKGEIKALIPAHTSDISDVGVSSCGKANGNGGSAYLNNDRIFSTGVDTGYGGDGSISIESYVYKFNRLTNVVKVGIYEKDYRPIYKLNEFKLQYSNDGSSWKDAYSAITVPNKTNEMIEYETDNDYFAYYWRIKPTATARNFKVMLGEYQFYGSQKDF